MRFSEYEEYSEFDYIVRMADILICIAYFTIPLQMAYYTHKYKTGYNIVTILFIAFILSCGLTHLFQVFGDPNTGFWILGVLKWITAIISVACAIAMLKAVPAVLGLQGEIIMLHDKMLKFTGYIFHEVRVPMNSIKLGLQILQNEYRPNLISMMNDSLNQMSKILNDALEIRKLESGNYIIEKTTIPIREIYNDVIVRYKLLANDKNIEFVNNIDPELLNKGINIDKFRFLQCINNLLDNAIKYTQTGTITYKIEYKHGKLIISISDTGCGIKKHDLDKLFYPYVQIAETTQSEIGTGLGLTITKNIIELHGGKITVNSTFGVGSTFTITIPLILSAIIDFTPPDGNNQNNIQFLVVDDNKPSCLMFQEYLKINNVLCDICFDGSEVLERFSKGKYVAIVMDENMPKQSGSETIKQIRKIDSNVFILGLTGDVNGVEKMTKAGANHVLMKPIMFDKFKQLLYEKTGIQLDS